MESNEVLAKLPKHLLSLVIDQPYNEYTARDHAVWRYVMRQNIRYLTKVAHGSYIEGLRKTGINIEQIPHMYGMNRILRDIGWAAVAVDGFIPPTAFMEFQAYKVLVIAADIRPINQIEYTPAPDIIHEAAGHAPIIADPEYAEYLQLFGEIGSKAFSSAHDYKVYEAIRHLSILKADPYTNKKDIEEAEEQLAVLDSVNTELSEMSLIRNLHWWTVEYGLIGEIDNPKIYGAGLLSSIGESYSSLQPVVKKIPYDINAVNYQFDITTRQPQLFITPNFDHLSNVLDEFGCRMALRRGGLYGVQKAIESENIGTCEYSSGLQVSGVFTEVIEQGGEPVYIKTTGPTSLNYRFMQLEGHDKSYHNHGFSSPVGKLKNQEKPLEFFTDSELKELGINVNSEVQIEFESGVKVKGTLDKILRKERNILLLTFTNCLVKYKDKILFNPSWGVYDMAVGEKIFSAFSGAADPNAFEFAFDPPKEKTHKIIHTPENIKLHSLYQKVRDFRSYKTDPGELEMVFQKMLSDYPTEWLLAMEILEQLAEKSKNGNGKRARNLLLQIKESQPELAKLIDDGLELIKENAVLQI